jgi:hypothetical protein
MRRIIKSLAIVFVALFVLIVIAILGAPSLPKDQSQDLPAPQVVNPVVATVTIAPTASSTQGVSKESFDLIGTGMSISAVEVLLGEPSTISESETAGFGAMEMRIYQSRLLGPSAIVMYHNGLVYSKQYVDY